MPTTTDTVLPPLPDFIRESFIDVLISPDDAVFEAALKTFWSPRVQETDVAISSHLTRAAFGKFVQGLRTQFSERKLVKETFVIATPADSSNKTGAVAATKVFSALQGKGGQQQQVVVTVVAVMRIEWVPDRDHNYGGRREIVTEAFITNTAPYDSEPQAA
ncbi:hypothetical protein C8R45DRAFT_1221145 [Mycena sanguinolenta]|nr:hypothetical protein C8R45DRAFT_1221145 [Mycena sanguinolenta]